jgi:hypothetical protein
MPSKPEALQYCQIKKKTRKIYLKLFYASTPGKVGVMVGSKAWNLCPNLADWVVDSSTVCLCFPSRKARPQLSPITKFWDPPAIYFLPGPHGCKVYGKWEWSKHSYFVCANNTLRKGSHLIPEYPLEFSKYTHTHTQRHTQSFLCSFLCIPGPNMPPSPSQEGTQNIP